MTCCSPFRWLLVPAVLLVATTAGAPAAICQDVTYINNIFPLAPRELRQRLTRAQAAVAEERYSDAVAEIGEESGYATARSVVDALVRELGWKAEYKAIDHPAFIQGRAAELAVGSRPIGILGEVHPEVLTGFGLTYPVALAELALQRVF